MSEQMASCPLCGSSARRLFDQREFRGDNVTNVICHGCGLVYQSPRMTSAESQAFYQAEYRLLYQGQEGPSAKDLAVQSARAQASLDFVTKQVKTCSRHLDIGCSTGILLQKFSGQYHSTVLGVEPGTSYRQYAQSQGLTVYASLEELEQSGRERFELVSMMHVLEHLPDPVDFLRNLREKQLAPAGWLLIEVPNLYAHDCFEVAHLVSFSAHTLEQVVRKAGYRLVRMRAHGLPRSKLIPLYLSLLAQPDGMVQFSLEPERLVSLKRKVGFLHRRTVSRLFPAQAWIEPAKMGGE